MQRKKKNPCFGIWRTHGKHLLCPADCGSIFPSKSSRDAWPEVRWIWWIRQNFVAQFIQLLKHWLCDVQSSTVVEKNWALSVDQCRLQALPFSEHLINLLSVLLRHNGFSRIQKAVVDQTSIRPPNSDHDPFFGASLALGSALELLLGPITELVIAGYIKFTFHRTSQSDRETVHCCCVEKEKRTLQNNNFFDLGSVHQAFTYRAFSLFQFASKAKEGQNGQWWVLGQLLM